MIYMLSFNELHGSWILSMEALRTECQYKTHRYKVDDCRSIDLIAVFPAVSQNRP